jgi:hypothetical protein
MKNLIKDMQACWQVEGKQSIWNHGMSVFSYSKDIMQILNGKESFYGQKIPQWMLDNKEFILNNLVTERELRLYTIFHDCGKPYCKPDS